MIWPSLIQIWAVNPIAAVALCQTLSSAVSNSSKHMNLLSTLFCIPCTHLVYLKYRELQRGCQGSSEVFGLPAIRTSCLAGRRTMSCEAFAHHGCLRLQKNGPDDPFSSGYHLFSPQDYCLWNCTRACKMMVQRALLWHRSVSKMKIQYGEELFWLC